MSRNYKELTDEELNAGLATAKELEHERLRRKLCKKLAGQKDLASELKGLLDTIEIKEYINKKADFLVERRVAFSLGGEIKLSFHFAFYNDGEDFDMTLHVDLDDKLFKLQRSKPSQCDVTIKNWEKTANILGTRKAKAIEFAKFLGELCDPDGTEEGNYLLDCPDSEWGSIYKDEYKADLRKKELNTLLKSIENGNESMINKVLAKKRFEISARDNIAIKTALNTKSSRLIEGIMRHPKFDLNIDKMNVLIQSAYRYFFFLKDVISEGVIDPAENDNALFKELICDEGGGEYFASLEFLIADERVLNESNIEELFLLMVEKNNYKATQSLVKHKYMNTEILEKGLELANKLDLKRVIEIIGDQ